jgi:signal transduction histidine kinase
MRFSLKGLAVSERWFNRLVVGAISLGFIAILSAGVAATTTLLQNREHVRWVNHTYQVERGISQYRVLEERLEAARRGYLLRGDASLSRTFTDTADALGPALAELQRLTSDNPSQEANIRAATALTRMHLASLRRSVALITAGRRADAIAAFNLDASLGQIRAIRTVSERMLVEEDRLLAIRNAEQERSLRQFFIILAIAGALLLIVAAVSILVIVRYTGDLATSRDQLRGLNANLEGAVRERTADLQRANEEIQRFAYIVSHDLRSPLVNVMGFTAELETAAKSLGRMLDKVEEAVPDKVEKEWSDAARLDLPEAIGFIRTSTQKMDRLINAILRLSREGRRPISPEALDLRDVLQGVADSLRHRSDELGIVITVGSPMPDIHSDRLAIEQIFSNIVENATKYLQPGRPGRIEISGAMRDGRAVIEVKDNGRGVDPRDHERIFDLFRRSGMQDQPGEGIGLAHTRALAYRLGGTITVDSRLGEGAAFRVSLPRVYAGEQGS